jgi:hypothetical protein
MGKIELTTDEIEVIELQLSGKIEINTATDEQQAVLTEVIDKAEALADELDDYDFDDLIKWYYDKYKNQ